jgi:flagellar hook-length control protein FliK
MFEAAMRAARLLNGQNGTNDTGKDTNATAYLTGGAGQQTGIATEASNKIASDLMPIADDKSLMTALEMFVKLAGEGGILDLTNTTFDEDKQKELMAYFGKIGISTQDAQRLLDLINSLKKAGAASIAVLEVTDEDSNDTVLMTDEEKRKNVDVLAQMADLLYPQMGQTEFEAQLELLKVTPEPAIISNKSVAMVLVPQFEEDTTGKTQYFTPSDLLNAFYTVDGFTAEQLTAFKGELENSDLSFGEVIKTILGEQIAVANENGEAEVSPKTEAAAALGNMIAEFKKANAASQTEQTPREYEMNFTAQTFRTRIVQSPDFAQSDNADSGETDANEDSAENADGTMPQIPFADKVTDSAENANANNVQTPQNTQNQAAVPAVNTANFPPQSNIHTQANVVRTEVVNTPVYDPPEVQLAGRIMSMDLKTSDVQEMTVVLNPEALGEVAVKVTNEGGAVTVALTAANPETQKLLNNTAATLLQSLKAGGADIREVLVIASADAGSQMGLNLGAGGFTRQSGEGQNTDSANSANGSNRNRIDGIDGIDETDETAAAETDYESRGARLWQTA